jgi:hypothetical protein
MAWGRHTLRALVLAPLLAVALLVAVATMSEEGRSRGMSALAQVSEHVGAVVNAATGATGAKAATGAASGGAVEGSTAKTVRCARFNLVPIACSFATRWLQRLAFTPASCPLTRDSGATGEGGR